MLSREQKEKQRAFSPIKTLCEADDGESFFLAVAYGIGCGILSSELGIKRMFSYDCNFMFLWSTRYILFLSGPGISI